MSINVKSAKCPCKIKIWKLKFFFLNSLFFIVFYGHSKAKIFSLDQFCANINDITSKLENYCQKLIFHSIFWLVLGNEDKIMICPFFKFSALEHFCGPKLISWVDIWVVLIWYSFHSVRVDLEGELKNGQNVLEKWHNVVMRYYSHLFQMPPKKKTEGIQRAYNMAVAMLRGDVWVFSWTNYKFV